MESPKVVTKKEEALIKDASPKLEDEKVPYMEDLNKEAIKEAAALQNEEDPDQNEEAPYQKEDVVSESIEEEAEKEKNDP